MKLFLSAAVVAGLATSAFATNAVSQNDLSVNSSHLHVTDFKTETQVDASLGTSENRATYSTRNKAKKPVSYAYTNPLGVGPYNDSR